MNVILHPDSPLFSSEGFIFFYVRLAFLREEPQRLSSGREMEKNDHAFMCGGQE